MAVVYKQTMSKSELLEVAASNNIPIQDDMTKAEIIEIFENYNQGLAEETQNDTLPQVEEGKDAAVEENAEDDKESMKEYDLFVYAGPTLPYGRLKENAVFRGTFEDIKQYLSDVLEEYPQIKNLIVPTEKLASFSVKVKTPGNIAHKYYSDIVSAMRGTKEV